MRYRFLLPLFLVSTALSAEDLDFYRDIYPFLKNNCISCHNKTTTKADLRRVLQLHFKRLSTVAEEAAAADAAPEGV